MDRVTLAYCGPGPEPGGLWTAWNLDPWLLLGLAVLAGLRLRPRRPATTLANDGWFVLGWGALALAFVSPLCALSVALFSARIGHHLLLAAVAAPCLALALRHRAESRLARPLPVVPLATLHAVLFWVWHAPGPYAAALAGHGLYWLMELSILGSALLFWLACLDRRAGLGVTVPAIIGVMAQMGLLGALLAFARAPLHAAHAGTTWPWGLSPLEDQQLAGLVMWVPGALPYLVAVLALVATRLAVSGGEERQR